MKTFFRILFGGPLRAPVESPLFRLYLNEFNSPHHARRTQTQTLQP